MRFILSAAILLTAGGIGFAAEGGRRKALQLPEQNRCFCVQEIEESTAPARIIRFAPPQRGCKKVKYAPGPEGTTPQENGLLNCEALRECLEEEAELNAKTRSLLAKGKEAAAKAAECCSEDACDEDCAAKWRQVKLEVAEASVKFASEEAKKEPCIPVKKAKTLEEELNTDISELGLN
ncbi:MAG TPA: hypothetical protein DCZ92_02245 [Elusimicrobia bacterium]|nr:MAG: hypothetical protein A2016_00050 [Elusimicrobia bacterium GWF2_62_30]HBA59646.1 hypothetical protein [Elusimicrobiota bacterium]